jgi:SAM-dependent methyltransferase
VSAGHGHPGPDDRDAATFWEEHYGQREQVWSGRANPVLVDVAATLPPGTVLDVGCGEGGDAVWLALRGWRVTAVDLSRTALERAASAAAAAGVGDRVTVEQHDLSASFPSGTFDLVSAQYLHSPVAFPREHVLRSAAAAVAAGGLLLVVGHAGVPSWAPEPHPDVEFPTPEEVLASLDLSEGQWAVERLGSPEREVTGPDGHVDRIADSVVAVRRLAA